MRIIGGQYGGRLFSLPKSFKDRPTTDIAKEALFNILMNNFNFETISVLDLFCGTGSISFEFASRMTKTIIAVDNNVTYLKNINTIKKQFNFTAIQTIRNDVFRFLLGHKSKYEIIFADPPFNSPKTKELPTIIFNNNLLNTDGWFILEHPGVIDFSYNANIFDHRKYGAVHFSFFKNFK